MIYVGWYLMIGMLFGAYVLLEIRILDKEEGSDLQGELKAALGPFADYSFIVFTLICALIWPRMVLEWLKSVWDHFTGKDEEEE